jgi:hypothetical protein
MELAQALQDAFYILEEERVRPTLNYRYVATEWPVSMKWEEYTLGQQGYTPAMAAITGLDRMRGKRPREVEEDPGAFKFESVNFTLLLTIMNQLAAENRPAFIVGMLKPLLKVAPVKHSGPQLIFPQWNHQTSSLSLLAEFCIRTGHSQALLDEAQQLKMPSAGVAIMLMEIEEIIALNYNLFSRGEIDNLPKALAPLREVADLQTWSSRSQGGRTIATNPQYRQGYDSEGAEIVKAIDGITQECNQARYFYLKGVLQQNTNLEIENDRVQVEGFLSKLGFSNTMIEALNAADSDYKSNATPFELKNCLGHLRSFLEHLHREAVKSIAQAAGDTVKDRWGEAILYLRQQKYFTQQHESFVTSVFTLLSDESVHPLTTEREYARLLRNVVIEYGVMFLTALDKRGVRIQ